MHLRRRQGTAEAPLPAIGPFAAVIGAVQRCYSFSGLPSDNTHASGVSGQRQTLGYLVGTFVGYGAGVASLLVAPVVIAGGIALLQGKRPGLVRTAAILAMIPVTSCCCVVGIPIGFWILQLLKKPDVEAYFRR